MKQKIGFSVNESYLLTKPVYVAIPILTKLGQTITNT